MLGTLAIALGTTAAMIALIIWKPDVRILGRSVGTYWLAALAGALTLLLGGFLPPGEALRALTADAAVNPLKILTLFLSMSMLSVFLDEVGFFRFLACRALRGAGTNQKRLFLILYATVSVLTVFTSNDVIILTLTPFLCYFCANASIDPFPYLIAEFVAANSWSMLLVIGNPTNVYLATLNGIGFLPYLRTMALPTLLAGAASLGVMLLLFKKKLQAPMHAKEMRVFIRDERLVFIGVGFLALCTVLLAVSSYLGIEMWAVTLLFAAGLFVTVFVYQNKRREPHTELVNTLRRAPWSLVPFVLSMFILVLALEKSGFVERGAAFLTGGSPVFSYGAASFLAANLINNIPMSVLFSGLLSAGGAPDGALFATAAASNLAAIATPVGALAGIMWQTLLKKQGLRYSFAAFVRSGAVIALPALAAALLGLALVTA